MPKYVYTGYDPELSDLARNLRKGMTKEEKHLWYDYLRNYPIRFYRQRPICGYIVDFYCAKAKLIIELDGSQHYTESGEKYDSIRTDIIEKLGIKVIRFTNLQINREFESVCFCIDSEVKHLLE